MTISVQFSLTISKKRLKQLERAFTDVAIKKELLERFLAERPTVPGKWSK